LLLPFTAACHRNCGIASIHCRWPYPSNVRRLHQTPLALCRRGMLPPWPLLRLRRPNCAPCAGTRPRASTTECARAKDVKVSVAVTRLKRLQFFFFFWSLIITTTYYNVVRPSLYVYYTYPVVFMCDTKL